LRLAETYFCGALKTKFMRLLSLSLLLAGGLFASCGNTSKSSTATADSTTAPAPKPAPESALGPKQTDDMMQMLASYYELKDALVATDTAKADAAAARLSSAAEQFKNSAASLPQYTAMQPKVEHILKASDSILSERSESIETQRAHFDGISDAMFAVLQEAKLRNGGVYRQHCPMAFEDKGAYWLSAESEIKNPYYGKKMLECGEVTDSL
jgi:Cu(I)/Ag(I) efflux system membrane fusion protein